MQITFYGHSCFSININNSVILFDPFVTPNELAKGINIDEMKADYVFLSHAHQDHIYDALHIAKNNNAQIVGIWEIGEWAIKNGHTNIHQMNIGGTWKFEFGMVQMVYASHSSSFADGSYGGQACGFVFKTEEKTFYYSGDTALTLDMQLIAKKHKLDFAFLPIGGNFTMDIDDAIGASNMIECNQIIGMHYDTFDYIKINQNDAKKAFESENKTLTLLKINDTINI